MSDPEKKHFDAFLSFNSLDRPAVRELAEWLRREGLVPYLDQWDLRPGLEFQPTTAAALCTSKTCLVFLGPSGLGPWQEQELQVAIDLRVRDETFHVIPVLLPGAERPRRGDVAHLEFLINASWVEFRKTLDDEQSLRRLVWGITGRRPAPTDGSTYAGSCPYRGLEAFRPEDRRFFFGRESLTGWLVSALRRELNSPAGVRFLGVLGPSGCGKSSVVLAGLVPSLQAGVIEESEHWPIAFFRPGDDPLVSLAAGAAARFLPAGSLPDAAQVLKLADQLRADGRTLAAFAHTSLQDRPEDVLLLLVVDQFEEVFTYRPQDVQARVRFEQARASFFANLVHAVSSPGGRVAVVLTMRSDFLSACATFPQLSALLSGHQELVGPMTQKELREAIERPAELTGCEVEPAMTERLLADLNGQMGALPLMQFALTEVWKKRDVRRLTLRTYEDLGGIEGTLEHRADEIYAKLSPEDQDLCKRLFLRLVQPGEGTEDTKRRVSYRELLPKDPARAEAVLVLVRALADRSARLITTDGDNVNDGFVEVTHEALIRGWAKLREWIAIYRDSIRTQRRVTEAAREWSEAPAADKNQYLYSGARLAGVKGWASLNRDELNPLEAKFLADSEEAERRQQQDSLQRELRFREEAETAGIRERQLRQRFLVAVVLAVVFAMISGALAGWANLKRSYADRSPARGKLEQRDRAGPNRAGLNSKIPNT